MAVSAFAARHVLSVNRIAPPPPSPPVTGYSVWYDALRITGWADNSLITLWPDLSGNANNLTAAGGTRPTYYSSTAGKLINGNPAVYFNGSVYMQSAATVAPPGSLFIIASLSSITGYQAIMCTATGGTEFRVNPTGVLDFLKLGQVDLGASTGTVPAVTPFMAGVTYDAAHVVFYINSGTADSNVAASTVINSALLTPGGIDPLIGSIGEIVWYPTVLTGPQISSTYTYLKTKWGTP